MTRLQRKFAQGIFADGLIEYGSFKLKHHERYPVAPLSPFKFTFGKLRSLPELQKLAVEVYWHQMCEEGLIHDMVADVPSTPTPTVAVLAYKNGWPMVTPRKDGRIDGVWKPGQVALLVDDVITSAESKLAAIRILTAAGIQVDDVLVMVDREEGGRRELERLGVNVYAVYTLTGLFAHAREAGLATAERAEMVQAYLAASRKFFSSLS